MTIQQDNDKLLNVFIKNYFNKNEQFCELYGSTNNLQIQINNYLEFLFNNNLLFQTFILNIPNQLLEQTILTIKQYDDNINIILPTNYYDENKIQLSIKYNCKIYLYLDYLDFNLLNKIQKEKLTNVFPQLKYSNQILEEDFKLFIKQSLSYFLDSYTDINYLNLFARCKIKQIFSINLDNGAILLNSCLYHKQFIAGYIKENKIIAHNVSNYIGVKTYKDTWLPECIFCSEKNICEKGCLAHQYNLYGELFIPDKIVCNLLKIKNKTLIELYDKYNIYGNLTLSEQQKILEYKNERLLSTNN